MEDIRYGIIGTGMMGVEHILNLNAIDGTKVVAVADPHAPSVEEARAIIDNDIDAFASAQELVDADLCDAVVIATPNMTHREVLDVVLPSDLHVLVEKPLCTTVADCEAVVEAANARDAITWVGLEYRYMAPVSRLIEEVRGGAVGTLHMVSLREHRFPFLTKVADWNRFSENTGGTLVEKCCHYFDLMTLIADARPHRVIASGGQSVNHLDEIYDGRRSDLLDNAYVIVEFEGGLRGMLELSMFAEGAYWQEIVTVVGDKARIEARIPGSHGVDELRHGEISIGVRASLTETTEVIETDPKIMAAGAHHGSTYYQHAKFLDLVRNGGTPEVSVADGAAAVRIGAAAEESARSGQPVCL